MNSYQLLGNDLHIEWTTQCSHNLISLPYLLVRVTETDTGWLPRGLIDALAVSHPSRQAGRETAPGIWRTEKN